MKILVPIKRVVDYNVKVRPKADGSDVDLANVKMAMNPFCEIAVEEAIRLKEASADTGVTIDEIVVVSIGPSKSQEQIRAAMAIGADRGILVETDDNLEPLALAKCLLKIYQDEAPGLVIFGKQSIDGDNNQTGQMFAALAGLAQATFASELKLSEQGVEVTREIDGGLQTLAMALPAVVTTDLRLNEPRYAALPNIMKAKRKPLAKITLEALGLECSPRVKTLEVAAPAARTAGVRVNSVDELVDKLVNEAKVV